MRSPTIIETLCEISGQLHGIHASIKRQTEILVTMRDEPKEAAPAPKAITWQEAARTLRDLCEAQRYCAGCHAQSWCDSAVPINTKVITPREWEVPADE